MLADGHTRRYTALKVRPASPAPRAMCDRLAAPPGAPSNAELEGLRASFDERKEYVMPEEWNETPLTDVYIGEQKPEPPKPKPGWWLHRKTVLVVGVGGIALAVIGFGVSRVTGPSYPHSWCGETLTAMHATKGKTFGGEMNQLRQARNDGAPTDNLISDENSLAGTFAQMQYDQVSQALSDLALAKSEVSDIDADAEKINTQCGEPAQYRINSVGVPSQN